MNRQNAVDGAAKRKLRAERRFAITPRPAKERCDGRISAARLVGLSGLENDARELLKGGRAMSAHDFVVKDLSLAEWGRKEIAIAETEMPGLMAVHARSSGRKQIAQGRAHLRLAAHDDPDRGADRNPGGAWRASALGLVQHLLHPGSRRGGDRGQVASPVFAIKGETLEDYWAYTDRHFPVAGRRAQPT
jgi:hypothetical protein